MGSSGRVAGIAILSWLEAHYWLLYPVVFFLYLGLEFWAWRRKAKLEREAAIAAAEAQLEAEAEWVRGALQRAVEAGHWVTDLHFPDQRVYRFDLEKLEVTLLERGEAKVYPVYALNQAEQK